MTDAAALLTFISQARDVFIKSKTQELSATGTALALPERRGHWRMLFLHSGNFPNVARGAVFCLWPP